MFLTAKPTLSASGSVPITISALTAFAKSIAILKASGSSGLGDFTVLKLPSGIACSLTICKSLNPAPFKTSGRILYDVPCIGVKTIL